MRIAKTLLGVALLIAFLPGWAQMPRIEDRRYEDWFTFKNGKTYTLDPFVWGYTKEFAERFRMPEQWIEPELKGAMAVAFRMTTIGDTMCGLGGRAENCWPALECQMDIYYDSSIELPWNYPEMMRDNVMRGLSSKEFLHDARDKRGMRRYVFENDSNKPRGIMSTGGGLRYGKYNEGGSFIIYFDREYEPGVALIGYRGMGVCPKYAGSEQVFMSFSHRDDLEKYFKNQISRKELRIVHRIDFPQSFLARARTAYTEANKPNEQVTERLIQQFFASRGTARRAASAQ